MPGPIRSLPPPSKRRKVQQDPGVVQSIQRLEQELTNAAANNGSLNPLADLLDLALKANGPQDTSKIIYALYRVFVVIISNNKLALDGDDTAKVVKAWIWERMNTYVEFLGGLLKDEEKILRVSLMWFHRYCPGLPLDQSSALQILFSLQKHLSTAYSKPSPQFHISHFRKVVSHLLLCPPSARLSTSSTRIIEADVLDQFHETWFSVYDDVRWFFLREAGYVLNKLSYLC
jgi:U3 small nucleolar RNA-associated protein 19